MRVIAALLVVFFGLQLGSFAEARKRRPPKRAAARVVTKVNVRPVSPQAAEDYQKAEAQLADLRTTREIPVATLDNQDSDAEIPGQRATSK